MNPTALRQAVERNMNILIGQFTPTYGAMFTLGNVINLNGTDKPFRFTPRTRKNLNDFQKGKVRLTNFANVTQEFTVDEAEEVLNHFLLFCVEELVGEVPERLQQFAEKYKNLGWNAPYCSFLN